jgi:UDP-N-acetylglucosamine 2-epimerase (non-hydrolysing)
MSPPDPVTITFLETDDINPIMPMDSPGKRVRAARWGPQKLLEPIANRLPFDVALHTNVLFVFGTRPEAIKLCPVLLHMRQRASEFSVKACVTAQHRGMLDQVLAAFQVAPDYDLDVMQPGQTLAQSTARILSQLEPILAAERPGMVLVQGDTTTTLSGALAAFYQHIPVGHVEAGLRTGDLEQPFPEEMNRVVTTRLAALHFAPTPLAAGRLAAEGVPGERIFVTGNSGIDAVLHVRDALASGAMAAAPWTQLDPGKKLIVVTAHRRESFGAGFEHICAALIRLARRATYRSPTPCTAIPTCWNRSTACLPASRISCYWTRWTTSRSSI